MTFPIDDEEALDYAEEDAHWERKHEMHESVRMMNSRIWLPLSERWVEILVDFKGDKCS